MTEEQIEKLRTLSYWVSTSSMPSPETEYLRKWLDELIEILLDENISSE